MDFNVAEDEQFSPNKLRAQMERLYMGAVGISVRVHRRILTVVDTWVHYVQTAPLETPVLEGTKTNIMFLSSRLIISHVRNMC